MTTNLHTLTAHIASTFTDTACCLCATPPEYTSRLGLRWCFDHQFRAEAFDWGVQHGCPAMDFPPYAILGDVYHWFIATVCGSDTMVWSLLGTIDVLSRGRVA